MKPLNELGISKEWGEWHNYVLCPNTPNADDCLLKSAPDLYEALEECERKLDACDPYCNLLERVRAALAKASGESEVAK